MPHEKGGGFDVQKLQEDIIKTYLVGKPLIECPAKHLRMCFKFRVVRVEAIAMGVSEADLELLSEYIKVGFKVSWYHFFAANELNNTYVTGFMAMPS